MNPRSAITLAIWLSGTLLLLSCASVNDEPSIPALFGKDVFSTTLEESRISFTPDGRTIYFARGRAFFPVSRQASIFVSHWVNG